MESRRKTPWLALVVPVSLAGAAAAFAFARGADAQMPVLAVPTPTVAASPAKPVGSSKSEGHEEGEPEDRHGGPARAAPGAAGDDPSAPTPPPATSAKATVLRINLPLIDGMLRIPGGKFIMTSGLAKNQPLPRPTPIAPFWIDRTEVTVAEYRACVSKEKCTRTAKSSAACTFDLGDPQLPISCVHWSDADNYCRAMGKRLPTEAEWEFAAHGNANTTYPWGGGISCSFAVTLKNERTGQSCVQGHPDRVGVRPNGASTFGVLDMSGNVEEWTSDWYVENLGRGPAPRQGASHVLRGGGWLSAPSMSRSTTRNWGSAVEAGPNVGFRCAKDA